MAAPKKWFLNPLISSAFADTVASRARPMQPDTTQIDTLQQNGSGYTGNSNPKGVVGQVEGGEWVFSKPVTDAFGQDTLQAMKQRAESGQMDARSINNIRQAVGLAPLRSFQEGTDMTPSYTQADVDKAMGELNNDASLYGAEAANTLKSRLSTDSTLTDAQRSSIQTSIPNALASSMNPVKNTVTPSSFGVNVSGAPVSQVPTNAMATGDTPPVSQTPVKSTATPLSLNIGNLPSSTKTGTTSDFYRNLGMAGIASTAAGKSPYFETLQEMQQRRLSGEGSAQEAALRQELAQGGAGGGVARSALGEQARDASGRMAEARSTTTVEQMRQAEEANKTLASEGRAGQELELNKSREERLADESNYTNLKDQYDAAIKNGQFDKARAMWAELRQKFPTYMSSVEPDWTKLGKDYDRGRIDDINSQIGKLISTGSSLASVEGLISDSLEATSGMSIEDLAARSGKTTDQLIKEEYDRIKDFGADDVSRTIAKFRNDFGEMFDTPEEARVAEDWIKNAIYQNWFTLDDNGNLTYNAEDAVLPWNAPKTAHLFDSEAQANPDMMAARTSYVASTDSPLSYDTWKTKYNDWFTSGGEEANGPLVDYMAGIEREEGRPTTIDIDPEHMGMSITDSTGWSPTGQVVETTGEPIKYDNENKPYVYTYDMAISDANSADNANNPTGLTYADGTEITNADFGRRMNLNYYMSLPNPSSSVKSAYVAEFKKDPGFLSGVPATDNRYLAVVGGLTNASTDNMVSKNLNSWMHRDYDGIDTPMKLTKVDGNIVTFQLVDGSTVEFNKTSLSWNTPNVLRNTMDRNRI